MARKLDAGQRHILVLIGRDADSEGWTPVSEKLYQVFSQNMPTELATFEKFDVGGRARLTKEGQQVFDAMAWL